MLIFQKTAVHKCFKKAKPQTATQPFQKYINNTWNCETEYHGDRAGKTNCSLEEDFGHETVTQSKAFTKYMSTNKLLQFQNRI